MAEKQVQAGEAASDRMVDRIQFHLIFAATFITLLSRGNGLVAAALDAAGQVFDG